MTDTRPAAGRRRPKRPHRPPHRAAAPLLALILASSLQASAVGRPADLALPPTASRIEASPSPTAQVVASPLPASPSPIPSVRPSPSPSLAPSLPQAGPFALNLFQEGDFVPQHTFDWCVGASIQMAHNLVRPGTRSSYADQQALWEMARDRSANSFNGANPHGWAAVLNEIGVGPYQLVSVPAYDEALRVAARALRLTERPVGLVMWRGRHAWVMSGFESHGDPAVHADFTVTGVRVLDPLYPHGSGTWGPSPAPNSLMAPDELARQFVVREPRRWSAGLVAGYLLVLPVAA
ncbi:MAG: hypothetical protein ACRDHD_04765 [Candidatus Limnocylindria bacterium]